jgi:hypothetical protein
MVIGRRVRETVSDVSARMARAAADTKSAVLGAVLLAAAALAVALAAVALAARGRRAAA